ncbi:Glycosyltransferase, catalytic subunit of cellulose synthase and poly-beta-1,6-N-acetylglucosamine synthase [Marinitoga hydrogenitolerans DSM 16785]|uniref:Glycosyltransferase, catalytic subunit of cellulose synthase and poly-beta-1,6-N-acetylglucosamine synthase n=1 Tax=Marinitoga hydrogenitolerans (strain DSM 16785 / JCM 12826 / AT1271) TaxID=1122195 RepID=A0A1M4Y3A9_MARH1|nr:glycosyltransferase family 2 protein [Marinitoga hydrogenitolerans]SHF00178.1 Glycosyltransferase, catalytic subunit of cellulose synthase and poly-beta-1,6-N-acetylglucosamine synthase [Marinitoga hydrogenitolerans DSM 16785]
MKKVSIIIPTLNEEKHIEKCIKSLLDNNYENKEIIVVDGMSEDKTREILKKYDNIKIIDNELKITPVALNIGIKEASGDYIMIAGAHTTYSKNYISACIKRLEENKCDIAGGLVITNPGNNTSTAKAISTVLSHPFGIGGAKYRLNNSKEEYVDTVAYGIYKKEIFEKVGMFVPQLKRNQDIEMNLRLKNAGMRIMLIPEAKAYYYARDNFKDLFKNNFQNGLWVILSTHYSKKAFSLRHIVPLLFVLFLLFGSIASIFSPIARIPFFIILSIYLILSIYFSFKIAIKNKKVKLFFPTLLSFWLLHISYGLGSFYGLFLIL